MYIDTHCHVSYEYFNSLDDLIIEIKNMGIGKIIVNGCDMKSNLEVIELVKKYDIVYGAIGFHPTELSEFGDKELNFLSSHINDDGIVAIGEIGLDYHYSNTNKELQIDAFRKQLEIASMYDKPVIVHSRDAINDTYDILQSFKLRGSIHCFSGSLEMANKFINLGFYIGVGGVCTYNNSKKIKNVIENIDIAYILLETDSPYLTPEPFRNEINTPSYIPVIAKKVSEIKKINLDITEKITTSNAERLFDLRKKIC